MEYLKYTIKPLVSQLADEKLLSAPIVFGAMCSLLSLAGLGKLSFFIYTVSFVITIEWRDIAAGEVTWRTFWTPVWLALGWKYYLCIKLICKTLSFLHII